MNIPGRYDETLVSGQPHHGEELLREPFIVALGAQGGCGTQEAKPCPCVVVTPELIESVEVAIVARHVVPPAQAEGGMLRIREHTIVENRLAGQPVREVRSNAGKLRLLQHGAGQRQGPGRFAVIVGTPPPQHGLRAIVIDLRAKAFQQTQAAVARGGVAARPGTGAVAIRPVGGGRSGISWTFVAALP